MHPALTPEQWSAEGFTWQANGDVWRFEIVTDRQNRIVNRLFITRNGNGPALDDGARTALGALCLAGHFTHADLEAIDCLLEWPCTMRDEMVALRARIAALLPPEAPHVRDEEAARA